MVARDRDAFILACAEIAGRTYEEERALWDAAPSRQPVEEPVTDDHWSDPAESDRAADRYERRMQGEC